METGQKELFWSFKEWFTGNKQLGLQILGNIAFFVPLGYMLAGVCRKRRIVVLSEFLLSCLIEVSQLVMMRGLFEFDDIIDNTLGGFIGVELWNLVGEKKVGIGFAILSVLGLSMICLTYGPPVDMTQRLFCFQVDEDLSGYFMMYEHNTPERYEIFLRPTAGGEKLQLDAKYGISRPDVNDYFSCEYDYTCCGFQLRELPEKGEYEFIIKYRPFVSFPTGVYVSDGKICYSSQAEFNPPVLKEDFVNLGWLRVYRPDYHCWVYQYKDALYWIADEEFFFDPSGSTYIQYQLWTTQTDKLPQHRLDAECYWDNIGGYFETHELEGDFGGYRVMIRDLPTEYAITAILTGYHDSERWIWQSFFRPIYDAIGN